MAESLRWHCQKHFRLPAPAHLFYRTHVHQAVVQILIELGHCPFHKHTVHVYGRARQRTFLGPHVVGNIRKQPLLYLADGQLRFPAGIGKACLEAVEEVKLLFIDL